MDVEIVDDPASEEPPEFMGGPLEYVETRPWWLVDKPPAKGAFNWPSGGRSPSWFTRFKGCPLNHSLRYRHRKPDPTGLFGLVGNAVHGSLEDAGRRRMQKTRKSPIPPATPSVKELLYYLEHQKEVAEGEGVEVLLRATEILEGMAPRPDFTYAWGIEYIWSYHVTPNLLAAGIADLIKLYPDRRGPNFPPRELEITDYKTGPGQIPSEEKLALDPQANMQLIWGRRMFPTAERVTFKLWNVAQNTSVKIGWTQRAEDLTMAFMRSCNNLWLHRLETPIISDNCKYCPYRSECKKYRTLLRLQGLQGPESLEGMTPDQLMGDYDLARTVLSLAETRKKDISDLLLSMIPGGQKSYETPLWRVTKQSKPLEGFRNDADVAVKLSDLTQRSILQLLDAGVLKFNYKKLMFWAKGLPETQQGPVGDLFTQGAALRHTAPWIKVTKKDDPF